MSNRLDWSEWILQKNNEYKKELNKMEPSVVPAMPPGDGSQRRPKKPPIVQPDHKEPVKPNKKDEVGKPILPKPKKNVTSVVKSLPDWSEWVLNKNQQATEELNKGVAVAVPPSSDDDSKSKPKKGESVFNIGHVNEVAAMKDHSETKKLAHSLVDNSNAKPENKKKIKLMIDKSKSSAHLAQGMANHILAHPGEGLRVIKNEDEDSQELSLNKAKDMAGDDVDSSMLMSELESMDHHIEEIRDHLKESEVAPDWVKAKVSRAASSISDIAHYVMGIKQHK